MPHAFWPHGLCSGDDPCLAEKFQTCLTRYHGDYKASQFSCWDQYLCMAFAQLTYRESLRDIEACLRAVQPKLYQVAIRARVSRPTLADANETRDWRIYADVAHGLIRTARELYVNEPLAVDLANTVYALDATIIDFCLSVFPWARYRRRDAAVMVAQFTRSGNGRAIKQPSALFRRQPAPEPDSDAAHPFHAADPGGKLMRRPASAAAYATRRTAASRRLIVAGA